MYINYVLLIEPSANLLLDDYDNKLHLESEVSKRCQKASKEQEDFDLLKNQDCVDLVNYQSTFMFSFPKDFKMRMAKLKFFQTLVKSLGSLKYQ